MITADFNRDGKADLAIGTPSGLVVELGKGDGTFTQSFSGPGGAPLLATADLNQDGKLDIVGGGGNGTWVLLGNGDGTFQPPLSVVSGHATFFVAIADFNLDGKPDLVVVNNEGTTLYLGNGDGTFQTGLVISPAQASVVAGDFNRDGKPDLILGYDQGGTAVFLLGNGDGTFQSPVPLPTVPVGPVEEPGIEVLSVGDFNNDGKLDLGVVYPSLEAGLFPLWESCWAMAMAPSKRHSLKMLRRGPPHTFWLIWTGTEIWIWLRPIHPTTTSRFGWGTGTELCKRPRILAPDPTSAVCPTYGTCSQLPTSTRTDFRIWL